jgi:hypothetical protein
MKSWRDDFPVHPAADLFPLMSPDELRALGEDIIKDGLTSRIVLWRADPAGRRSLRTSRKWNRLRWLSCQRRPTTASIFPPACGGPRHEVDRSRRQALRTLGRHEICRTLQVGLRM